MKDKYIDLIEQTFDFPQDEYYTRLFSKEQSYRSMRRILGY